MAQCKTRAGKSQKTGFHYVVLAGLKGRDLPAWALSARIKCMGIKPSKHRPSKSIVIQTVVTGVRVRTHTHTIIEANLIIK